MNKTNGYDRIAFAYDFVAGLVSFNQINKSQLAFLPQMYGASTCLILGGGTGCFLEKLLAQHKKVHVTYVDASAKMITSAKKRIQKEMPHILDRVRFVCIDVNDFDWGNYDLIVCNYFLDLFDDAYVDVLAATLKKQLNPGGLLYVTDFNVLETTGLLRWCTLLGLNILYRIHRRVTKIQTYKLPAIEKIMDAQGFTIIHSKKYLSGILMCRVYRGVAYAST